MFCKARKIPLPLEDRVKEKLETMLRQGVLEPIQTAGVTNASPVLWQQKWSSETMRGPESSHVVVSSTSNKNFIILSIEVLLLVLESTTRQWCPDHQTTNNLQSAEW